MLKKRTLSLFQIQIENKSQNTARDNYYLVNTRKPIIIFPI